ncbi:MAG: SRPBCC domain-containing protein [Acidobacteriia bacterium]|nr:SRPBCC domain-containing protein [Terriglobia bacterium]
MKDLRYFVKRDVLICARPDTVFRFFTDSKRFASWWGAGSEIESRPGGKVLIRYPDGTVASGEVLEIEPLRRIVFSYGYKGADKQIPPGGSRVTLALEESGGGTLVRLRHDVDAAATRDAHVQGWRYQMAVFANVVANEQHAGVAERVDALFRAWSEADGEARKRLLESSVVAGVTFRDAHGATSGLDDLHAHIAGALRFMPGIVLVRDGEVRHCQGTATAAWVARKADGNALARGTNVYDLAPDGRIARVVGLWGG